MVELDQTILNRNTKSRWSRAKHEIRYELPDEDAGKDSWDEEHSSSLATIPEVGFKTFSGRPMTIPEAPLLPLDQEQGFDAGLRRQIADPPTSPHQSYDRKGTSEIPAS